MIIQARQAFKCQDKILGELTLKYLEIKSGVDEAWKNNEYFQLLLKDGLIVYFEDNKDATLEKKVKESKQQKVDKEENTELTRALDEAKAKAIFDAKEVAKTQGYPKDKADEVQKTYIERYTKEVKEKFALKNKDNKNE